MDYQDKISGLRKSYLRGNFSSFMKETYAELQARKPVDPRGDDGGAEEDLEGNSGNVTADSEQSEGTSGESTDD